jgi:protein-S-isoprenylcysteine O-methyltransferase Ste14
MELARVAAYLLVALLVFALLLFVPAGTVVWWRGWQFLLIFFLAMTATALWLWRVNPEIYIARRRIQKGTKRWDVVLLCFLLPTMTAILPVAALDDARFHWLPLPAWAIALGYALLLAGVGITGWAQAVNRFFEPGVRIQTDRGHRVIDTGPYAIVRHSGYVGACLLLAGIALALGSLWALVPAGLCTLVLIVRTQWEDQTLGAEFEGLPRLREARSIQMDPGLVVVPGASLSDRGGRHSRASGAARGARGG